MIYSAKALIIFLACFTCQENIREGELQTYFIASGRLGCLCCCSVDFKKLISHFIIEPNVQRVENETFCSGRGKGSCSCPAGSGLALGLALGVNKVKQMKRLWRLAAFLWQQLHCGKQYFCYLSLQKGGSGGGILYSFVSVPIFIVG